MIKLTITDPKIAMEAGQWCTSMFSNDAWDLWPKNVVSDLPRYEFWIFNKKDAVLFKLRWSEYV